jgi:hypothetical protein
VPLAAWLGYAFLIKRPRNQAHWEVGMEVLADVTVTGRTVHVQHVRDFTWGPDGLRSSDYLERTYDIDRLKRVWFVKEPFTIGSLTLFRGVAHTYFVFDFDDQPPVAVSVEARRERGETFDVLRGLVNQFELIYLWGTERDLTGRRVVPGGNQIFMYPLLISPLAAQELFLRMARVTEQLSTTPRFYNSLTSNCTNELAKAANAVHPGAIPANIGLIFPGYADQVLYRLGFLSTQHSLQELRQQADITGLVRTSYADPNLSRILRSHLLRSTVP